MSLYTLDTFRGTTSLLLFYVVAVLFPCGFFTFKMVNDLESYWNQWVIKVVTALSIGSIFFNTSFYKSMQLWLYSFWFLDSFLVLLFVGAFFLVQGAATILLCRFFNWIAIFASWSCCYLTSLHKFPLMALCCDPEMQLSEM